MLLASGALLVCAAQPGNCADWRKAANQANLPQIVKKVAKSLIENEMYDVESVRSARVAPPAADFAWTPRPALDYLNRDDDNPVRVDNKRRTALVLPVAKPILPVPVPAPAALPIGVSPSAVAQAFKRGRAGAYSTAQLVSAGVFADTPLKGSVYKRREPVKFIILHSTETALPADARRVILSWNNRGLRHPGAQFVVDRDGTICSTVQDDQSTVHIDTSRTLPGYSNDNSIGIEIVRSGKQQYTRDQLDAVTRLVAYLQSHYDLPDENVTTHQHVQPSDRSDPVGFDLAAFESEKLALRKSGNPSQTAALPFVQASTNSPPFESAVMPKPAPDFRLLRN